MSAESIISFASQESLRMQRLASEYRQLGFLALAQFLKKQSVAATRYAVRQGKQCNQKPRA